VTAGPATCFNPTGDFGEAVLDISSHLIKRPAASYWFRVGGTCMRGAGILDRDLILVDNGITARERAIVVVVMDGELLIKRYRKVGLKVWLEPDPVGEDTPNIEIGDGIELNVFGVVTSVVRDFR
jgi:DNA polymerase V